MPRVLLIDGGQSGSRARYLEGVPQSASPSVKQRAAPSADATPGVTFSGAGSSPPSGTRTPSRSRRGRARAERRGPGLPRHGRDYRALRVLLDDPVDFVAAGLTGFDGDAAAVARALGMPVIVSNDAVTAHLGALGGEPGVVIVAGTGVIALAVGADGRWARADGLGSRLGDDGGGYWIGRRGLAAALRARDGRPGGSPELLRHAVGRFGERIVPAVYDADDPVAVIADFARDVADAANAGDEHALSIWSDAASELAATALTAARAVAATGESARPPRPVPAARRVRRPRLAGPVRPRPRLVPRARPRLPRLVPRARPRRPRLVPPARPRLPRLVPRAPPRRPRLAPPARPKAGSAAVVVAGPRDVVFGRAVRRRGTPARPAARASSPRCSATGRPARRCRAAARASAAVQGPDLRSRSPMTRLGHLSTEGARAERAEIDRLPTAELVRLMNDDDRVVPEAVAAARGRDRRRGRRDRRPDGAAAGG